MSDGRPPEQRYVWGILVLVLVAVAGLYHVKWNPYFHKALVVASRHSLGASIVSGTAAAPPPASWHAAWEYAVAYGRAIWQALIVGLVLAAGVQALLPPGWIARVLGRASFKGVMAGGLAAVPSMM